MLVAVAALAATACRPAVEAASYALEPVDRPFAEFDVRQLGEHDSARWLDDGRLFVEARSDPGRYLNVQQLWVTFAPDAPARVELRAWSQETRRMGATWPSEDIRGTSWVSGGPEALSRPDGPGLTIQTTWSCRVASDERFGSLHLHLRPDQVDR